MDLNKERAAFEGWFGNTICDLWCADNREVQMAWEAWQAAKASAVPDGYVLVPKEPTRKIREAMYMAQHYHMSVINPDEWDAVDKSYKAMIEAVQEQNQ